jgi:hypothetical protein
MMMCFRLAHDLKAGLLQRADGVQVIDAGQAGHRLDLDLDFPDNPFEVTVVNHRHVLADCIGDVFQCLLLSFALRVASRQNRARHGEAFFVVVQDNPVSHVASLPTRLLNEAI